MKNDELRELAQRLVDGFPPSVTEVVLTGSVSRGVADELSDIEMLVLTEEQISLEEAFALARGRRTRRRPRRGETRRPRPGACTAISTGSRSRRSGGSPTLAEERFATGGSAEAIANGVALRGGDVARERAGAAGGLSGRARRRAVRRPPPSAGEAGRRAGSSRSPDADTALARMEWLVDSAQRVLQIVFAVNRAAPADREATRARASNAARDQGHSGSRPLSRMRIE